jgi:hypothetical protein
MSWGMPASMPASELLAKAAAKKPNKMHAEKTVVNGVEFASKAEARRFNHLKVLERAGRIKDLQLQPVFVLAPAVVLDGRKKPALRYVADFSYVDLATCKRVIEDVKGMATPVYRIKRHLMKTVLGLEVKEVR